MITYLTSEPNSSQVGSVPASTVSDPTALHKTGNESAAGTKTFAGPVVLSSLPTVDPAVIGQLWNDTGTLKVSAGP